MRILLCGSRSWSDAEAIAERLVDLPSGSVILHGCANGADMLADEIARGYALTIRLFPADWERHGRSAGILRNNDMLDTKPDLVLAFWDGKSRGTRHTIDEARRRGIPVEVIQS